MQDVHRRIVRSFTTGKIIDDCVVKDTPSRILHRRMKDADDIRVELIMEGALKMYEEICADVSEVYSQPRIAQEAALRTYGIELGPHPERPTHRQAVGSRQKRGH